MNTNVVLIGMPGCGKSTCGVIVAKMLLKNFFDTDLLIQNIEGMSLQNIIDTKGTDYFESAEESAILNLDIKGTVIATGGSVVYSKKAMEHLKKLGTVVFLNLSFGSMQKRISNFKTRGVLMKKGNSLLDMYNERLPLYQSWADVTINCDNETAEDTAQAIYDAVKNSCTCK